ncbi:carboxypeptidase B-like [Agrilus planipennis]|uniref:Carboxypeptidase B-like n=1 Tax=Agrilus planipennis TaxID=224129 RepID=A0A1W4XH91_AGRPL|nr:carboxypeptidase B-like [Agrilus planipennis]
MYIFYVFLILLPLISADISDYDGFKVYAVDISSREQLQKLDSYSEDVDFWTMPRRNSSSPVKMMVNPFLQHHITKLFEEENISYRVVIPNVAQFLHEEDLERHNEEIRIKRQSRSTHTIRFDRFLRHSEINQYLQNLEQKYPDFVSVSLIGHSYEGREILAIKIGKYNEYDKPIIFIDAGIHAREWISSATALYIINQLVEYPENKYLSDKINWYILPNINPDGYEYSHTSDRLWRKTRSKTREIKCAGVDGNRNFSFLWGLVGASSDECSETYKGPFPFSEVELQAFRNFSKPLSRRIKLYLSLHSYGNYIIYPFGHRSAIPKNENELKAVGSIFASSISKRSEERWTVGATADVLYEATGASEDWMMAENGVKLAYTIELQEYKGRGFNFPQSKLLPAVQDTFVGIKALHSYIEKKYCP